MEEARVKMKELEEQRNTMQSAQLSAERQKRAVAEKCMSWKLVSLR